MVLTLFFSLKTSAEIPSSARQLSDRIITRYLNENPPKDWPYDWTTAIFLQGALSSKTISDSKTNLVNITEEKFSNWKKQGCCLVTMADLAAMAFSAVQLNKILPNGSQNAVHFINLTKEYFATEPLNAIGTYNHVGARHKFFWWAPPTRWFVPSSLWADSIVMSTMTGFAIADLNKNDELKKFNLDQIKKYVEYLKDENTGLYKHAFYIESKRKTPQNSFWARGNAWLTYALGYFIENSETDSEQRKYLSRLLEDHVLAMNKYLDSQKGFRTLLNRNDKSSSFESSSLALYTTGVAKGLRLKAIDDSKLPKDYLKSLWTISSKYLVQVNPLEISVTEISKPTTSMPWDFYYTNIVKNSNDISYGVGAYLAMIEELRLAKILD